MFIKLEVASNDHH